MPIILALFGIFIFFFAMYLVVKAAINNSEAIREIKVMLMKTENENKK